MTGPATRSVHVEKRRAPYTTTRPQAERNGRAAGRAGNPVVVPPNTSNAGSAPID
jgi:hypothetical protein